MSANILTGGLDLKYQEVGGCQPALTQARRTVTAMMLLSWRAMTRRGAASRFSNDLWYYLHSRQKSAPATSVTGD